MSVAIGVDVGATNITIAVVDDQRRVLARHKVDTPEGPDAVVEAIAAGIAELDADPSGVGVGVPGPVKDGVILTAPNLPGFPAAVDVAGLVRSATGLPTLAENDATVGVIGEWVAGAGRGATNLLGVWLGTGVGGGLVLDGRPYRGSYGAAGEFGHMTVRQGGALCGCGRRGCVEAYAGRIHMERQAAVARENGVETLLEEIRRDRGKERLTSSVWAKALQRGDALAQAIIAEAVEAVGVAVGSVINLLDLDRIVIGGGITDKLGAGFVEQVAAAARRYVMVHAPRDFVPAALGDDAGVVGAAALVAEGRRV